MVSSRRLGREGQRRKMHILQVPVKSLWGRKLKLMGKLWLSFIYVTIASISQEMWEGDCAIYHCPLCVPVTLLTVLFSGFKLTLISRTFAPSSYRTDGLHHLIDSSSSTTGFTLSSSLFSPYYQLSLSNNLGDVAVPITLLTCFCF